MICGTATKVVRRGSRLILPGSVVASAKMELENGTGTLIDLPLCLTTAKTVGCHNNMSARYREVSMEY